MATTDNISTIALQAVLDKAKSVKNINKDIAKMEGQLKLLEIQVKTDAKSLQSLNNLLDIWSRFSEAMEKTLK